MIRRALARIARSFPVSKELLQMRDELKHIRAQTAAIQAMETLRCYDIEVASAPRYRDRRRLLRYALQVNSQNGEDGMIREIFHRINTSSRIFVEIGVGNGTENNTAFLLSQGWKGFWIDGSSAFLRTINARTDLQDGCLISHVGFVERESAAGLFARLEIPREFDLLSIDVDQNTFYLWDALREFAPRVVVIEYNAAVPPDIDWKVQYVPRRMWDGTQNFGASLKALEKLGRQLGYSLVGCDFNGVNAFFVRDDFVSDKFADPFTAENHYEPPRYSYVHPRGHARAILDRQQAG